MKFYYLKYSMENDTLITQSDLHLIVCLFFIFFHVSLLKNI